MGMRERRKAAQEHLAARHAETAAYLAGPPVPDGYERGSGDDFLIQLVCLTCGASVMDSSAGRHDEWHASGTA